MSKKMILAGWLAVAAGSSMAQTEEAPTDTLALPEISVSITKQDKPAKESTKPVQVITSEVLEQSQGKDLSQVLQEQTGIIINSAYSNPGKDKGLYLRGASSKYTLILLDGVPVNDPSGVGGAIDPRLIALSQIERIEILKGSQSTLYGTDAIAGVINIITKKGAESKISAKGAASVGSLSTSNASVNLGGKLDKLKYNVGVQRYVSEGISEATAQSDTLDFDNDGLEQTAVNANLNYQLTDALSINPSFVYSKYEGGYDDDAFTDAANTYEFQMLNAGTRIRYTKNKLKASANYAYTEADRVFNSSWGQTIKNGHFHNVDAFANYEFSKKLSALVGLQYQDHKMVDPAASIADPAINILSPYLSAVVKPIDGLNVELGYRLNTHSLYGNNSNYSLASSYWLNDKVKVFGSYTTGFKAPTLSDLYGAWGGNPNLKPETSVSMEGGLQLFLLEERLKVNMTYFDRAVENIIVYEFIPGNYNRDLQEDYGFEFNANFKLNDKVSLVLGYDYVNGSVTEEEGTDTTFYNLIRRPKHSGIAGLMLQPTKKLKISVTGQYLGERIDYFFNPANFWAAEEVTLDAYLLLNLYAEYAAYDGKIIFFADLKNITNTDFTEIYGYNTIGFNSQFGIRFNVN